MQNNPLPVLYEDSDFIAVIKPHNLLVHRTELSTDSISAVQIVREMTNCPVNPVHRIDRGTNGVLLFAKSKEATKFASDQFMNQKVEKSYLAIIRGWPKEERGIIDSPISTERGENQSAETHYEVLEKVNWPVPVGRFPSSWYSLIKAIPKSGRMHQIRRHLKRLCGPVIGDTQHGDGKHNRLFREQFNSHTLLLFANTLTFKNMQGQEVFLQAPLPESFKNIYNHFEWK